MRLVFVNRFYHPDESATSQMLTDLCVQLAARGHDVRVVTSRKRHDDPKARLPARESIAGVEVRRIATTRFGRGNLAGRAIDYLSFYLSAAWTLLALLRPGDVVIAKTDPPLVSVVASWACRRRGAVLVNWLQDVFPEVAQRLDLRAIRGRTAALLAALRDRSLRAAAMNVALGERMARHLEACVPSARVTVIPNWADGASVKPVPPEANTLRDEWGLRSKFVVGYSGNMGRAHEFETVLEACSRLSTRDDVAFLFVGAGSQRRAIEARLAARGARNVRFEPLQSRERLASSLGAADVHLVTLKPQMEGLVFPSKFYGIVAAGRPVLFVGDVEGDIPRTIDEHRCGISVRSGDAAALVGAIERLAGDPWATRAMGGRARTLFEARFDLPLAVRRWETLLESVTDVMDRSTFKR